MEPKKKSSVSKEAENLNNPPHGKPVKGGDAKKPSVKKQDKVEDDPKKKKEDKGKEVKEPTPAPTPAEVSIDNPKGDDDYRKEDPDKDLLM